MPTIAYLSQRFKMAFAHREILALRRRGLTIRLISTWPPDRDGLSAEARPLLAEAFPIFPASWLQLLCLHRRYLARRPGAYLGALLLVLILNRDSLRNRLRSLGHFVYAVRAADEIERCGAQHLHADFALNAATVALVAARLTGRPFSFAAHAADLFVNPTLLREKVAAAAFVIAISEYNQRFLVGLAGDPKVARKIHIIHCGLDLRQFTPAPGRRNDSLRLLSVGRLVEKKGFGYLVEACHLLAQRGLRFECQIVGQGPEEAGLRQLIVDRALGDRLHLLGAQPPERVRELLQGTDVFALPCIVGQDGDQDGIPAALMEAMAMHVPVVSTPVSGITELVQDGVNGLLVPSQDVTALADAIQRLWNDRGLAARCAHHGRLTVEKDFNVDAGAGQLAELFQSVQADASRRAVASNPPAELAG